MAYKQYLLIIALLLLFGFAHAQQVPDYQQADSTTQALYSAGKWQALIDYTNQTDAQGLDFPALHQRAAYARFMTGNYSAALAKYQQVLKHDSYNPTARYMSMLCQQYLNRDGNASYQAKFVDTTVLNKNNITPFGLIEAGIEASAKIPNIALRGTGFYSRASLGNRLGWRLQLDQSVAVYHQAITVAGNNDLRDFSFNNDQFEYYARLGYTLTSNLTLLGAYHYLHTKFGTDSYQNHVELAGLKYAAPYFTLQADANFSKMSNSGLQQYNGELTVYPTGSLNLYTISRVSVQSGYLSSTIFNQRIGFKAFKRCWLEGSINVGRMDNYLEADALYVYNAVDVTTFKAGGTLYYQLGRHLLAYANYAFEDKENHYNTNATYQQNSITGGLTWRF
ncbi:hypothetical protein C8P68_103231 [Mucilaginibacter yixingensis]|uniref:Tetratricopeptide repeat protein n=1 Tax=Mucilaginibacter yixingensis TaxID=1295612 RepID=A0A2T5JB19_9SPHI|nr:hypothetical protein [Mucilaginibacter yixingensis]PTQ98071.1 hypothetical protein C8P68_103231 [Mucilaginibacter yixingensis]